RFYAAGFFDEFGIGMGEGGFCARFYLSGVFGVPFIRISTSSALEIESSGVQRPVELITAFMTRFP
ncbi:hypothetical protein N9W89_07400, partial [Hellea sp.]|nr:hypothetical protein [Hellea sp.]